MPHAELHCLSCYSFLRGASHPQELVARAAQLGYSALAITDECSLAGAVKAHVAAQEAGLHLGPQSSIHTGVISRRLKTLLLQPGGGFFGFLTREAINDARVIGVLLLQKAQQLLASILLEVYTITDIRSIEAGNKTPGLLQAKPQGNLFTGTLISGSSERDAWYGGKALLENFQLQVVGSEIMPPL